MSSSNFVMIVVVILTILFIIVSVGPLLAVF